MTGWCIAVGVESGGGPAAAAAARWPRRSGVRSVDLPGDHGSFLRQQLRRAGRSGGLAPRSCARCWTEPGGSFAVSREALASRPCRSSWSPTRRPASRPEVADKRGIVVVPLQVVIGADVYDEGSDGATPELVAAALKEFRPVSTSRPTPAALLEVYEDCVRQGATEIVSVHLSSDMSGTFESAQLAARDASVPVVPVDSRQVGVATGYAALSAADVVDAGGSAEEAADAAPRAGRAAAGRCSTWTRWSTCGAAGGSVPPPRCSAGRWRSSRCWRSPTAGSRPWSGCAPRPGRWPGWRSWRCRRPGPTRSTSPSRTWPARSGPLSCRTKLAARLADNLDGREVWCGELGAVLGAHVGPGMLAVCVAPLLYRLTRRPEPRARPQAGGAAGLSTGAGRRPRRRSPDLPRFVACAPDDPAPSTRPPCPAGSRCSVTSSPGCDRPARSRRRPPSRPTSPWWDEHTRPAAPRRPPRRRRRRRDRSRGVVPTPGRHAARRSRSARGARPAPGIRAGPDHARARPARGRWRCSSRSGLAVTCWWLVRGWRRSGLRAGGRSRPRPGARRRRWSEPLATAPRPARRRRAARRPAR